MSRTERIRLGAFVAAGLAVALMLVLVAGPLASSEPDGLEKVAQDKGFADTAEDHDLSGGPLAYYGVEGAEDEGLSTGVAGAIGVAVTFALGAGLFAVVRRTRGRRAPAPEGG